LLKSQGFDLMTLMFNYHDLGLWAWTARRFLAEGNFLRNPSDPRDCNTPDPAPQKIDEFVLKFFRP
jgi:hypothetical protein